MDDLKMEFFRYMMSMPVVDEHLCINMAFGEKKLAGEGLKRVFRATFFRWFCSNYRISMHLPDSSQPRSPFQDPAIQRLLTVLAETIDEKSSYDMRQVLRYADTRKTGKKNQKEIKKTQGGHKRHEAVWNIIEKGCVPKARNKGRVTVISSKVWKSDIMMNLFLFRI